MTFDHKSSARVKQMTTQSIAPQVSAINKNYSYSVQERTKDNFYDSNGRGILFPDIEHMFSYLPYASHISIGIKLLHYTGCRVMELDSMIREGIIGNTLIWNVGKNQKGYRKEHLPDAFLSELRKYWRTNAVKGDHILGVNARSVARYFNKDIRPQLNNRWQEKTAIPKLNNARRTMNWSYEYVYQLKGFRKNWATLCFYYNWQKFNSADIGLQLTCARMKHSTTGMTVTHYIVMCEQLNVQKYSHLLIFEIVNQVQQRSIGDYY